MFRIIVFLVVLCVPLAGCPKDVDLNAFPSQKTTILDSRVFTNQGERSDNASLPMVIEPSASAEVLLVAPFVAVAAPLLIEFATQAYKGISKEIQEEKKELASTITAKNSFYFSYKCDGKQCDAKDTDLSYAYIRGEFGDSENCTSTDGDISDCELLNSEMSGVHLHGKIHHMFTFTGKIKDNRLEILPSAIIYNYPAAKKHEDSKKTVTVTLTFSSTAKDKKGNLVQTKFAEYQTAFTDLEFGTILQSDHFTGQSLGIIPLPSVNATVPDKEISVPYTLEITVGETEEAGFFTNVTSQAFTASEEAMLKGIEDLIGTFLKVKEGDQAEPTK